MKEIYKALSGLQQDLSTINKNATGYGYKFADLENIVSTIKPLLNKYGLGYTQLLNGMSLKTILFHIESGETLESSIDIPQNVSLKGQNDFQVLGSAITYLRRYSLSSILGIVTDDDNDASGEQTIKKYTPSDTKKASDKQKMFIKNLLEQHGINQNDMKHYLATEYGIAGEMTQADAQIIIDSLDTKE